MTCARPMPRAEPGRAAHHPGEGGRDVVEEERRPARLRPPPLEDRRLRHRYLDADERAAVSPTGPLRRDDAGDRSARDELGESDHPAERQEDPSGREQGLGVEYRIAAGGDVRQTAHQRLARVCSSDIPRAEEKVVPAPTRTSATTMASGRSRCTNRYPERGWQAAIRRRAALSCRSRRRRCSGRARHRAAGRRASHPGGGWRPHSPRRSAVANDEERVGQDFEERQMHARAGSKLRADDGGR